MKNQEHSVIDSVDTPKNIDSVRLRNWWNKQAINHPDSAGVLSVYCEPYVGLVYRQEAEWIHFQKIVPLNQNMRALELGCGAGRWTLRIAPLVDNVVGVDFSEEMIRLARERQHSFALKNIEFIVSSAQDSIFQNKKFDIIYLSGITPCLNEQHLRQTLRNIQAMLAPEGMLIDRTSISLDSIREVYDDGDYQGIYRTLEEQKSVFKEFGFQLTYRAPSYKRMRIPHFLLNNMVFQNLMKTCLLRFPKTSVMLFRVITCFWERVNSKAYRAENRSHEFLIFKKLRYDI